MHIAVFGRFQPLRTDFGDLRKQFEKSRVAVCYNAAVFQTYVHVDSAGMQMKGDAAGLKKFCSRPGPADVRSSRKALRHQDF